MNCPRCFGKGEVTSIMCLNPGDARQVTVHCGDCEGTGDVTQERLAVLKFGDRYRTDRVLSGHSLRERAEQLGVRPMVLSDVEQGRLNTQEAKDLYSRLTNEA